ncbi:hypothetical protein CFPU101_49440 [Chroococcus sp. FPU101]|nr:hypothetical protein CFPU101_49440 [Chroococcus sp. FPU101]
MLTALAKSDLWERAANAMRPTGQMTLVVLCYHKINIFVLVVWLFELHLTI